MYEYEDKQEKYTRNANNRENIGDNEWESNLELEVVDLDTLGITDDANEETHHDGKPIWSASVLNWQQTFSRKRWRVVFVTGSLALVCLLLLLNVQGISFLAARGRTALALLQPKLTEQLPKSIAINPSLVLSSQQLGFSCVLGESWSPDSTAIAVLGYSVGCENYSARNIGFAAILNAQSGRPLATLFLDAPIKKVIASQYPAFHDIYIYYGIPTWSPDKRHIAFTFSALAQTGDNGSHFVGVLMYDSQLKSFRVLMLTQRTIEDASNLNGIVTYVDWDVAHGVTVPSPTYLSNDLFLLGLNIPTAASYSWGKNGALVPQTREDVSTSRIGNMSGDPSFSIWQSGEISLLKQDAFGFTYSPGIFLWDINILAWSPDGRYLIENAYTAARLEIPGYPKPDQKVLSDFHLENVPVLPIRDKALLSVLKSMSSKNSQPSDPSNNMYVEWSPNGKLLWITSYENPAMTLYTSHSGFPVATLLKQSEYKAGAHSSHEGYDSWSAPSWSPDGLRVLLQEPGTNVLVIWNIPHSLQ